MEEMRDHAIDAAEGIPPNCGILNATTRQALQAAGDVQALLRYTRVDALFDEMEAADGACPARNENGPGPFRRVGAALAVPR